MALSNRDRIQKGMDLLAPGLRTFIEAQLKAQHGDGWAAKITAARPGVPRGASIKLNDSQVLLGILLDHWQATFKDILGASTLSIVHELRDVRNKWAHQEQFSTSDAIRALDSMERLLTAVSAADAAAEVGESRMDLMRTLFDEQRRSEMRKSSAVPTEGKPLGGLKPWREVVTPHPDVASGKYQQAEFAADLWQVYQGEGSDEYRKPVDFFRRTFLTDGLKRLLSQALIRLNGKGGDPVVELQTNFGGGKTHSMLALYHLFSGAKAADLPGVDELVKDAGIEPPKGVKRAVFVGTQVSPGKPHKKDDGTKVHTIWGEIAWQIGGKEGYKLVKEDDEKATNPGTSLTELFKKFGPCLVLIDEWVAYARQLHGAAELPAGTFETQFTFAQAITEAAKAAKNTLVVVSIPASDSPHQKTERSMTDIEVGGERGREAVHRLKNAIGRLEASWRPASPDEGFEIVRRRLFEPLTGDQFVARDAVARAFVDLYGQQKAEFPSECREGDYERRMKMAYPIHPELFDRLFTDWSTLEKFQRTRGVLRLMAAVIHSLWERQDSNLLIMPGNVPIDDQIVQFELTRYLEDSWVPVIEKDVDGPNSLPLSQDRGNPNLGRFSASRRVARTIYMGSAPTTRAAHKGIEERQVKLGCVQPGETTATFGDALRRLTDTATYLYVNDKRYWYSTQPTVTRMADDRATQLSEDAVSQEIVRRLRAEAKEKDAFAKVHACVPSSDIPDEKDARLVILGPEHPHVNKDEASAARREAAEILERRGTSPRNHKNTLLFLAADATRLRELEQGVRQYLAWKSVCDEKKSLNLDPFQTSQAETKLATADSTVNDRILETYHWVIVPEQNDPQGAMSWSELKATGGKGESLAGRVVKKTKNNSLIPALGGVALRTELDRIPLWQRDHISVKLLSDYFSKHLYLPRLLSEQVLLDSIADGVSNFSWQSETFAYAEGWNDSRKKYEGLRTGRQVRVLNTDRDVLVKPEAAQAQLAKEAVAVGPPLPTPVAWGVGPEASPQEATPAHPPVPKGPLRFHASVHLDPMRLGRDAARIAEEIVQHLTGLVGSEVSVTLDIQAEFEEPAAEKLVRDVTENCRTLKFDNFGFEHG